MTEAVVWRRCGEHGVLIEMGTSTAVVDAFARCRHAAGGEVAASWTECVPGANTLYIESPTDSADAIVAKLQALLDEPCDIGTSIAPRLHNIAVRYDGCDLDEVAERSGLRVSEVVARHQAAEYTVAFVGFARGFAYLTGLDEALHVPRLATPRTHVPAGSVAIGAGFTGIYPMASPGGWLLIGTSDAILFDPLVDPPNLVAVGDRIRFDGGTDPSTDLDLRQTRGSAESATTTTTAAFTIIDAGPFSTVQDLGRPGRRHQGVARSGAFDRASHELANRLVGNDREAATLEILLGPLTFSASRSMVVAIAGTDARVTITSPLARNQPRHEAAHAAFIVEAGDVVSIALASNGLRTYVAFGGGIDAAPVLGSRSFDSLGRFGPRPVSAGDRLPIGHAATQLPWFEIVPRRPPPDPAAFDILLGPRQDWVIGDPASLIASMAWTIDPASNRTGIRLAGPRLPRTTGDLASEATVPGAVQLPPDGMPIILGPDGGTTGGYPVIGVVPQHDLDRLAQRRPGESVRFRVGRRKFGRTLAFGQFSAHRCDTNAID